MEPTSSSILPTVYRANRDHVYAYGHGLGAGDWSANHLWNFSIRRAWRASSPRYLSSFLWRWCVVHGRFVADMDAFCRLQVLSWRTCAVDPRRHAFSQDRAQGRRCRLVARRSTIDPHAHCLRAGIESGGHLFACRSSLGWRADQFADSHAFASQRWGRAAEIGPTNDAPDRHLAARLHVLSYLRRVLCLVGWLPTGANHHHQPHAPRRGTVRPYAEETPRSTRTTPQKKDIACPRPKPPHHMCATRNESPSINADE